MATTVGQHGVAAFTSPSNGDPLDATVVRANDNTLRSAYVSHDDDTGIHLQSSTLATRPTAGTAGRKWLSSDAGSIKIWYDNGATWEEVAYLPTTGDATLLGSLTVSGNVVLGDASGDTVAITGTVSSSLTPTATNVYDLGVTGTRWRNLFLSGALTASGAASIGGNTSVGGTLTVTSTSLFNASATVVGTVSATSFSGSGASLTNIPATAITPGQFSGTTSDAYTFNGSLTVNTGVSFSGGATISGNALFTGGTVRSNRTTANVSGSANVSYTNGNHVRVTLTGNSTLTPTGGLTGGVYTLEVVQDGTGNRTLAWGSSVLWSNGSVPAPTLTAARKDIYTFFFDGTYYIGTQFAVNIASTV